MTDYKLYACAHNENRNSTYRQTCTGELHFERKTYDDMEPPMEVQFYICTKHRDERAKN